MSLICFKHPKYDGNTTPVLSCTTCCKKFVEVIRTQTKTMSTEEWIQSKISENKNSKRIESILGIGYKEFINLHK